MSIDRIEAVVAQLEAILPFPPNETDAHHSEIVQLAFRDGVYLYLASSLPDKMIPILSEIDELFYAAFGNYYDWTLVPPDVVVEASFLEERAGQNLQASHAGRPTTTTAQRLHE